MSSEVLGTEVYASEAAINATAQGVGKITVLEALATQTNMISVDGMGRCTPDGTGVDYDD